MNDNERQVWNHDSTAWGLIQRRIQREREESERIEADKSEIDRIHEDALLRFNARSSGGEGSTQPNVSSADKEKINLAQQVDESKRVYWRKTDNGFDPINK